MNSLALRPVPKQSKRDGPGSFAAPLGGFRAPIDFLIRTEHVERRLAAVLAADVAAYSRLMGADEGGTLSRLKAARKALVDPAIAAIAAASIRQL